MTINIPTQLFYVIILSFCMMISKILFDKNINNQE